MSRSATTTFVKKLTRRPERLLRFHRLRWTTTGQAFKSLADQKPEEAKSYLTRAWEGRQQLDDVTQQSIQDQLARLTVSNAAAQPATANLQPGRKDVEAFRALQKEVFAERLAAEKLMEKSPRQALEKLAMIRNRIGQSNLDAAEQSPFLKMVDRDMERFQKFIDENLADIETDERNRDNLDIVERRRQRRADVERQLQSLVEDYNRLIDEQRFAEAEVIASQAIDLAPKSEIAVLLHEKAQLQRRVAESERLRAMKESDFLNAMYSSERSSRTDVTTESPWIIDDAERFARQGDNRKRVLESQKYRSESEARIWNLLKNTSKFKVTIAEVYVMHFSSWQQLLASTSSWMSLPCHLRRSTRTLKSTFRIGSPISLRGALQIILEQKGLVFVVIENVSHQGYNTASPVEPIWYPRRTTLVTL